MNITKKANPVWVNFNYENRGILFVDKGFLCDDIIKNYFDKCVKVTINNKSCYMKLHIIGNELVSQIEFLAHKQTPICMKKDFWIIAIDNYSAIRVFDINEKCLYVDNYVNCRHFEKQVEVKIHFPCCRITKFWYNTLHLFFHPDHKERHSFRYAVLGCALGLIGCALGACSIK